MCTASLDRLFDLLAGGPVPSPPSCQDDIDWTGVRSHDMRVLIGQPAHDGLLERCADCGYEWELVPASFYRGD